MGSEFEAISSFSGVFESGVSHGLGCFPELLVERDNGDGRTYDFGGIDRVER